MTPTIYAAFHDAVQAEKAADTLLARGVRPKDISLVLNQEQHRRTVEVVDEGLNPAQNDYPRIDGTSPTEFSATPPDANRMYNTGLETQDYNRGYDANVEREIERDQKKDKIRATPVPEQPETSANPSPSTQRLEEAGVSMPTFVDPKTTVTASAGLGIGVGALAAVAAIAIPGYGLILGGGALATAVAGLAASSKKGVVAEGIVAYLKDQGVPAEAIPPMQQAYESGGAILGVALEESPADSVELESILRSFGAESVGSFGYAA